jgi:hypothetical protein
MRRIWIEEGSATMLARRLIPAILLALTLVAPAPAAAMRAETLQAQAVAPARYSINLYRRGDFASQRTPYWCIGASMQMMLNIIGPTDDDSRAGQVRYMRAARSGGSSGASTDAASSAGGLRGAGSSGWARGLVDVGAGPYEERAVDGFQPAIRAAAYALRTTGRPVGLIVWRGAHAWVMSGFTATADPLVDPDYRITGVYIQDPWYPRISSIWGPGQKPNSLIPIDRLDSDFLPRRAGGRHADQAGKFVLVLPTAAPPSPAPPRQLLPASDGYAVVYRRFGMFPR